MLVRVESGIVRPSIRTRRHLAYHLPAIRWSLGVLRKKLACSVFARVIDLPLFDSAGF